MQYSLYSWTWVLLYDLLPPNYHHPKRVPTLIPKSFDKNATLRFSLAFQCIVNIGVHGSKLIRSRVVQAGTLNVVSCILESRLASKGTLFCCGGMLF